MNSPRKYSYYEKAEAYFSEAIDKNENLLYPRLDMARVLEKRKQYDRAIDSFNEAAKLANKYHKDIIQGYIEDISRTLECNSRIEERNQEQNQEPSEIDKVIYHTVRSGIEEKVFDCKQNFIDTFLREKFKEPDSRISLEVLKRWNSYTPLVTNSKGGGYFIRVNGKGIVIDPGFNFIENFKAGNYVLSDIDIVLVSHSHDDHTADLESIISLLHRYNTVLNKSIIPRYVAKEYHAATKDVTRAIDKSGKGEPLSLMEEEWVSRFNEESAKKKKRLRFYISEGVKQKYLGYFRADEDCYEAGGGEDADRCGEADLCGADRPDECCPDEDLCRDWKKPRRPEADTNYTVEVVTCEPGPPFKKTILEDKEGKFVIEAINASHEDKATRHNSALGFVFNLGETVLVYTGDTGWEEGGAPGRPNIREQYKAIKREFSDKKLIVIAHFGGFHEKEKYYLDNFNESLYPNHLGRLGLASLIDVLKPELCLISEWGEEFRGMRLQITEILQKAFGSRFVLLPADIGLRIDLSKPRVRVISDIDADSRRVLHRHVERDRVAVGEFKQNNSLFYYEKGTDVTDKRCLEAFMEGFDEIKENAYLSRLILESARLCPVFRPNVTEYTAYVSDSAGAVTVKAAAADPAAGIEVNKKDAGRGQCRIDLAETSIITITVRNGAAIESYTIMVKRENRNQA